MVDTSNNVGLRLNNPGNLRDPATGGFQKFNSPEEGQQALIQDLKVKQSGQSHVIKPGASLDQFASVWAPSSDNNNPRNYARILANVLGVPTAHAFDQVPPEQLAHAIQVAEGTTAIPPITPKDTSPSFSQRFAKAVGIPTVYADEAAIPPQDSPAPVSTPAVPTVPQTTKLTVDQFAQKIKEKYSGKYDDLDNATLTQKILAKYPQYQDMVDVNSPGAVSAPDQPPVQLPPDQTGGATPGPEGSGILGTILSTAAGGLHQAKEGIDKITSGNASPLEGAEAGLKIESGIASTITSPLAPIFKAITDTIGDTAAAKAISDAVTNNPHVQKFAMSKAGQVTARAAEDLTNAGNVAGTILGVNSVVKGGGKILNKITGESAGVTSEDLTNTFRRTIGGRAVLSDTPDVVDTLTKEGAVPDIIEGANGKKILNTENAYDTLGSKITDIEDNELQPALRAASTDGVDTMRPLEDLRQTAIEKVRDALKSSGTAEDAVKRVDKYFDNYQKSYGDYVSLEDINDMKRGIRNSVNFDSEILDKSVSYQIGQVFMKDIEQSAKALGLPDVHEINSRMGKLIQAQDALEKLDGKPAPLKGYASFKANNPVKSKLIKHAVKAAVGAGVGGMVGGKTGAEAGGLVGSAL